MSSTLNPPGLASFNEVLIKTVRLYPPLYINNRRAFENVDRNVLWKEVARKIGRQVTPEFAKKRWLQLRDRYRKELKIAIAHGFSQPQKWSHFHLLTWLDPYLQGSLSSALPLNDVYSLNGTALLELTDRYLNKSQEKNEKYDSCDSELLEDSNPTMSTIQCVLAATEASAIAASESMEKIKMEDVAPCQYLADLLENIKKNPREVITADYPNLDVEENPSPAEPVSFDSSPAFSPRPSSNIEEDQERASCHEKPPFKLRLQPKTVRNSCHPFSPFRTLRLRSRKRFKPQRTLSRRKKLCLEGLTNASVACTNCSASTVTSWLDDEDMLFARIIGLRLKKMNTAKRKKVRSQISKLLDDEEAQLNGFAETGTSVSEWS